jgi:oligopeptide transport system substrate-binding protein
MRTRPLARLSTSRKHVKFSERKPANSADHRSGRFHALLAIISLVGIILIGCTAPAPTDTPAPTARPILPETSGGYPPRPTSTPYSEETSAGDSVYVNADYGLRVPHPDSWITIPPDQGSDVLQYFVGSGGSINSGIFTSPSGSDTVEDVGSAIRDGMLSGLKDLSVVSDKVDRMADGRQAWITIATGKRDDGSELKIQLTTALYRGRAYTLFVFGEPQDFDDNAADIAPFAVGWALESPRLYGLPRDQMLVLAGGESTNPREYDPATMHGSGDKLAFSGLVSFDPHLKLVPELANTWEVSDDGTVYTFHLRPDARFHNGKPVTAADVIYSWERAADPQTASETVLTYLGDIVGVKEKRAGQAETIAGLKAINDHTLQVTIDSPKSYFLQKLTYPTAFVLDRDNVESGPAWYRVPNGTGPYHLARWDSFKSILYERNDDYYLEPAKIPYIVVQLYSGSSLRLYESGDIDITGVGGSSLPRFQDPDEPMHKELLSGASMCTGMIIFDNRQAPFDDPKVRQAFSLAFDRDKYIDIIAQRNARPAFGPLPPGMPGFNTSLQGLSYDPERARQLLAESKYGSADRLPPIVFTTGGHGSDAGGVPAALAQMWHNTLGITLTIENVEPDKYSDLIDAGEHGQVFTSGWCADYPDPENFVDTLFHTGSQQNDSNYSNPQVDALVEQARVERDVTQRLQLYQQAEQLIVDDAPVIFTSHGLSHALIKPYVKGYVLTPIDVPLERHLSIDASEMK